MTPSWASTTFSVPATGVTFATRTITYATRDSHVSHDAGDHGDGDDSSDSTSRGLSAGATAGLGVGVAIAMVAMILVLFVCWRKRRKLAVLAPARHASAVGDVFELSGKEKLVSELEGRGTRAELAYEGGPDTNGPHACPSPIYELSARAVSSDAAGIITQHSS
jgi:hypothetical protein